MDRKEYQKKWREAHKEELAAYMKKYNAENKERIAAERRAYYLANREKILDQVKDRYEENPQAVIDRATKWNKEHPEARKRADRNWTVKNLDKKRVQCKKHRQRYPDFHKKRLAEWRKANPLLVKFYTQQRRARIAGSEGTITPQQVEELYNRQGGKCCACAKKLNMQYHLDHVMPLSLGGRHVIENAQILCPKCNQQKHAMHPDEWAAKLGKLFV